MPDGTNFKIETKPAEPDIEALCERDEVLRVLVAADKLLSGPEKWCKGRLRTTNKVCAVGAIRDAGGMTEGDEVWDRSGAPFLAYELIESALRNRGCRYIAEWNDRPETTFADVKAQFARAISTRARYLTETPNA